jgi:hypothetical protein
MLRRKIKEEVMPTVGKKKFAYTAKGMKKAKAEAKKSGKAVKKRGKSYAK